MTFSEHSAGLYLFSSVSEFIKLIKVQWKDLNAMWKRTLKAVSCLVAIWPLITYGLADVTGCV